MTLNTTVMCKLPKMRHNQSNYAQIIKTNYFETLWSPDGKGLTSWLSFVISNCDVVTFPLVSWVRCSA